MTDYGYGEFQRLRTRIAAAADHNDYVRLCTRVTAFVQDPLNNPVYCDALVNLLMAKGFDLIEDVTSEVGTDTYALMATRRIARSTRTTVHAWRVIMEDNASTPEG